ncbi:MAG: ECF transporter S component [Synergistales bacterium]|nr:ECF transporter S component [Synergistales bacterium]
MKKTVSTSRTVALGAVLAAAVTAATMLHIPVPGFRVYFNLGEGVIYTAALLFGARYGAFAGGIGASMADLLLGYPLWAPLTFVIKGIEGYVVGKLGERSRILAMLAGAVLMTAGYTTAAGLLYGWKAAPVELVTDCIQTGIGILTALVLVPVLERRISGTSALPGHNGTSNRR